MAFDFAFCSAWSIFDDLLDPSENPYLAQGHLARIAWLGHKLSTMETVGHIIRVKKQLNSEAGLNDFVTMALDADGLDAGVFDRMIELGHSVGEIRGGKVATEPEDFINVRSELYWDLRERFERGDIDIDPNDDQLAKHWVTSNGSSHQRVRSPLSRRTRCASRGVPSPDRADALTFAFAHVDLPVVDVERRAGESITGDLMTKA